MNRLGMYIHIPFCEKKCDYCGFLSMDVYEPRDIEKYGESLTGEIQLYGEDLSHEYMVDTLYIGGGTPSIVDTRIIWNLLNKIYREFHVDPTIEISIEVNPNSMSMDNLREYFDMGINRLSMGAQSMDDGVLRKIGRIHDSGQVLRAFDCAREVGFGNISIDLIFGAPDQTEESWEKTMANVISMEPEHVSFYSLELEEGTRMYKDYRNHTLDLPDEESYRKMYSNVIARLAEKGYHRYEISSAAKRGYECRHNVKYWSMEEYIGLGLGASSYLKGYRAKNHCSIQKWRGLIEDGRFPVDLLKSSMESSEEEKSIYIFTALRKKWGIDLMDFEDRFGDKIQGSYSTIWPVISRYIDDGYMVMDRERLYLTEKGINSSNSIMSEFL